MAPRIMDWILSSVLFISSVIAASTPETDDEPGLNADPYLMFKPPFASSLPVQVLVTGIVLALVTVLLIHLLFTAQYHWPLAQLNYALQLSGVVTLLLSLSSTLHVTLNDSARESSNWPYMLTYIAVKIPPVDEWSKTELAWWYVMDAATSILIQLTHIQFLTLLYPSRLEARLIFLLLGPLAITSAAMVLTPIHTSDSVQSIAEAIKNVCNAALTLLFTLALIIWGFFLNRHQAWRMDGGTAAFGVGALILALASTGMTFFYIDVKEQYVWLPQLIWAVVLWQSFLGWWWWAGAGMGISVEVLMEKEAKRSARRRARASKRAREGKGTDVLRWKPSKMFTKGREVRERRPRPPPTSSASASSSTSTTARTLHFIRWCFHTLRSAHWHAARRQALDRVRSAAEKPPSSRKRGWGLGSYGLHVAQEQQEVEESRGDTIELVDRSTTLLPSEDTIGLTRSESRIWRVSRGDGEDEIQEVPRYPTSVVGSPSPTPRRPQLHPNERRDSVWWWGPLRRWRLKDATVY